MKNEKEKDKKLNNQSSSLIAIVSCISVLMLIAFYGVSLASKGTYSIDDETCTYSYVGNWVGQTASIEKSDAGCNCPNGWDQSYSYQYLYCSTALTNANNGLSYNRGGMTSCANGYQSTLEGDGCVKCNEGYRLSDEAGAATCVPDGSGTGAQVGNECETTGGQAGVIGADGTCVSNSIDDESGTNTDCIWGWSVVDFSNKRAQLTVNKLSCGCPNGWDLSVDSQGVCLKDLVVTTNGYKFERGNFTLGGNACPSDFTLNSSDECVYTTPNNGTAKTVTFTFKNDDDSDYAKQSCTIAADSDRCILYAPGTEPTSKTNAGVFNGWGSEKGCTDGSLAANAEFNNITRTTENKTYYACYTKKYSSPTATNFNVNNCYYSSLYTVTIDKEYMNCNYTNISYGTAAVGFTEANIHACCDAKGYTWVSRNFKSFAAEYCVVCGGGGSSSSSSANVIGYRCNKATHQNVYVKSCDDYVLGDCQTNASANANVKCTLSDETTVNRCDLALTNNIECNREQELGVRCNKDTGKKVTVKSCQDYVSGDCQTNASANANVKCTLSDNTTVNRCSLAAETNVLCNREQELGVRCNKDTGKKVTVASCEDYIIGDCQTNPIGNASVRCKLSDGSYIYRCSLTASSNAACNKNVENNAQTGSTAIIIAWIAGILAIGYAIYYFTQTNKIKG